MMRKLCLIVLTFSIILSISACNTIEIPQETDKPKTETSEEESTIETPGPSYIDRYLYTFENLGDYKAFLQKENYDLPFLEPELFEVFGTVDKIGVMNLNSSDVFAVEYDCSWNSESREKVYVSIMSASVFQYLYDDLAESAVLDSADIGDVFSYNLDEYMIRIKTEEEAEAFYNKYYPNGATKLKYPVTDQVYMWYYPTTFYGMIFLFDDCVVMLNFHDFYRWSYPSLPNSMECPTTRALLTKSTAPQTAEELYNLWKGALQ